MGLLEQAQKDIQAITSDLNDFGVDITFICPTKTSIVTGLHTKHHLSVNTDGEMVSSLKASVSVSEKLLIDDGYPVRNSKGFVDMTRHRVNVKDSSGVVKNYIVSDGGCYPDETIGHIVFILEFFKT